MKTRLQGTIKSSLAVVLATLLLPPGGVAAEEPPKSVSPVAVGSKVRLLAPTTFSGRVDGMVLEMDENSLLVSKDDRTAVRVSRQAITRLDVSTGRSGHTLKGLTIGAGLLAGVGAFGSPAAGETRGELVARNLILGALFGAGIGALIRSDRWNAVPLEHVLMSPPPVETLSAEGRSQAVPKPARTPAPAEVREAGPSDRPKPSSPIAVRNRIRLLAATVVQGQVEGTLVEMDEESLLVSRDGRTPVRVPRPAITRLEVSTGRHGQALKGMIIGAGVGALTYQTTVSGGGDCQNAVGLCTTSIGQAAAVGIVAGGLVGSLIGALHQTDRWSSVPLEKLRVSLAPTRGRGAGLTVSVGF